MLVLSRKKNEKVDLRIPAALATGEAIDIELSVIEIRGAKVRLGITAPMAVVVNRREVTEAIRRQIPEVRGQRSEIAEKTDASACDLATNQLASQEDAS